MDATQERRLNQTPVRYRNFFRKAIDGTASPRTAIKVMCGECMGWDGNFQQSIRDCTSTACPLFAYRPFQTNSEELQDTADTQLAVACREQE